MTLNETNEKFLWHCRTAVNLSSHTHRAYGFDLADFAAQAGPGTPLESIDKEALRAYIRHLRETRKLKETTIKRRIACLKLLFRWARVENLLSANPFDTLNERIRLPKRLPRALGKDEARSLRAAIHPRPEQDTAPVYTAKIAIQIMLATGIRVGELVSLRFEDIDLANASLKIHGKGNRQRLVYLIDGTVKDHLRTYLERKQQKETAPIWVFSSVGGKPLTTNQIRRMLGALAKSAGIERRITPHMLRHTSATTWLEAGLDIRYVQKLLGHQSISTTEIYTQVTDEGLRGAMRRVMGCR
jgi:integrase/recombinase XerD